MRKLMYILFLCILIVACIYPFYRVDKQVETNAVVQILTTYTKSERYTKQKENYIRRYYHLQKEDYVSFEAYVSSSAMEVDEITFFHSENKQQLQKIRIAIDSYLEEKHKRFDGYAPRQSDLLTKAIIIEKGNYLFLFVSTDANTISRSIISLF